MSKQLLAEKVKHIPPSGIRKFFDIVNEMGDAISLGVGEPDFDTPWHIRQAGIHSLEQGKTMYTANAGLSALREEVAHYLSRRFDLQYNPKTELLITVGGSEGIDLGFRAMINPGDEVLIPEPCFVSYKPCIVMAGGTPVVIPLKVENEFRLTKEELEAYITPKTKILVLSFPNNPTGAVMTKEDLEEIADVIIKHDIFVISDEIYAELTYGREEHVSIAFLPGMRERTLVLNGFSKAYAMTGWRIGYAAGPAHLIAMMTKVHQFAIMCAPTTSQYAAIVAARDGDTDIGRMKSIYEQRKHVMITSFRKMGLDCFEPLGAFYVFPSIRSTGLTSDEFANQLLLEERVAVIPGTAFGDSGEGFIRCSYAYSIEAIQTALERIERFVERIYESKYNQVRSS